MANTSLPNLTERTATANSDLIHVNSGGTDYKETKANFLSDVNSSITSLNNSLTECFTSNQLSAPPDANVRLIGFAWCRGSTTANLPSSSSGVYYHVLFFGTVQIAVQYTNTGASKVHFRQYANGQWYPWTYTELTAS